MDDELIDIDLSQNQKSRLLRLGLGSGPAQSRLDDNEQKMDMLYGVLTRSLPIEPSVVDSLPNVMRDLSSRLPSLAGKPIGDLLQDPKTDIATISRIKQYAKDSGTSAGSEDESDVFLVVYYAAIASALIFHDKKITQHPHEDLERFFSSFMKKGWVLGEIKHLLGRAESHCNETDASDSPGE